ncbi:AAA family ATPase [Candidatus Sumerlaeota bacterium]|nr:AAA family ATPase [Candidatus Sumerlaeota bacterium]
MNNPLELLKHINPVALDYEQWLSVGMALKDAGATATDWDNWSRRDSARYVEGECLRKWEGFRGSNNPVTIATLFALAKEHGWSPPRDEGRALDWDEVIYDPDEGDDLRIVDMNWIEGKELQEPGDGWDAVSDLTTYLSLLFDAEEHVGYVTESWEKDGHFLPKRGCYDRTAGQLIDALGKCNGDIGSVMGDCRPDVGAWIRFNPLDGQGVRDSNVTAFRFALVESDAMSLEKQNAMFRELELPITALVYSGGKSVHAIVRIEADTMEEYRKRVDFLYEVCGRNGLKIDRQNRNPSRLSRMPGVMRNGHKQYLIDTHIGKASWAEWEEWIKDLNDDLPDIEEIVIDDSEPELAPELIQGVLREGHKMLLSGSSKAGKSFALIQLAIAIAEGRQWFGWQTGRGRVLYVNLELDPLSCRHRFWKIYREAGIRKTPGMLDVWNLRGSATSMDKLAPKLIRRALKKQYKAVIIDPIYKVLTGDENSAEQMAHFCNQFDKICAQLGAATIVCHHHSKGAQGQKQSQDRSSGSGVFSRDPDTIIDLIELEIDEDRRKQIVNRWQCEAMVKHLDRTVQSWRGTIGQDDMLVAEKLVEWAESTGHAELLRPVREQARESAEKATGWRLEGTLREFPAFAPKTLYFRYPTHVVDEDGFLKDAKAEGEEPPWARKQVSHEEKKRRRKELVKEQRQDRMESLEEAVQAKFGEPVTIADVAEFMACTEKTVRNYVKDHPKYAVKNGLVVEIGEGKGND